MTNRRDYNDIPKHDLDYSTDRSKQSRSGLSMMVDDISTRISKDIIQPTAKNLLGQFIDLMSSTIKTAVFRKIGGGYPTNYNQGYPYNNGYVGNATYNPNDFRNNRFNTIDGYPAQPVGVVGNSPTLSEPWKNIGFRTELDADKKMLMIKERLAQQKYISVYQFGQICEQNWDFALDNYVWTDLSSMRVRYNIIGGDLPFDFADIPQPVYKGTVMRP